MVWTNVLQQIVLAVSRRLLLVIRQKRALHASEPRRASEDQGLASGGGLSPNLGQVVGVGAFWQRIIKT